MKVKLGKTERELEILKELEREKQRSGQLYYEYENKIKNLEACVHWWEVKDQEQRWLPEKAKKERLEIECRVRYEKEVRERVRKDLRKKRQLEEFDDT